MKSKKYQNLYKHDYSPNWIFRKYSKEKRREFVASTGESKDEAKAYKIGVEKFNAWLGAYLPSGRPLLIRDLARSILVSKENKRARTYKSAKNQLENHVMPAFGHLRPDQITPLRWKLYDEQERKRGKRTKLYNTRKALLECLHRAHEEKHLAHVPKLKNFDGKSAPPKYIPWATYRTMRKALPWNIRLLSYVMYRQGPRPSEALQYRYSMMNFDAGEFGEITIPGEITKTGRARTIPLNSRVSRVLRALYARSLGDCIFPSRHDPDAALGAYNAVWDRMVDGLKLDFTIYNLRDTFITNKLKQGFSSVFVGKYCDTSSDQIDRKYAVAEKEIMGRVAG